MPTDNTIPTLRDELAERLESSHIPTPEEVANSIEALEALRQNPWRFRPGIHQPPIQRPTYDDLVAESPSSMDGHVQATIQNWEGPSIPPPSTESEWPPDIIARGTVPGRLEIRPVEAEVSIWDLPPTELTDEAFEERYPGQTRQSVPRNDLVQQPPPPDCEVRLPTPTEIQIDADTAEQYAMSIRACRILNAHGIEARIIEETTSRNGRKHVYLRMPEPVGDLARIALQVCCGSDPVRELLGLIRVMKSVPNPSLMYEKIPIGEL